MSVEWNRFWCRVLFKEFIKHFRKLNDEQIVKDVRQSMDDLEDLVPDTDSFGSQMVRWSLERADEPFAVSARENGKKGGRPRKETTADGDTREDSQYRKSGTSANIYGDAATRDGADVSTTVSNNIGNGQGTEAPRRQGRAGADSVRGTPLHSAPARSSSRKFRNKEEFIQWAIDAGLDPLDAGECWDATLERGGKDADGNVVKNIKAFAVKWCKTRDLNRRSA